MMKKMVFIAYFLFLVYIQSNEGLGLIRSSIDLNLALRATPANGMMDCSKPDTIYPLLNGCGGWNMCGKNNMVYPFHCGSTNMCYNATSYRCDIPSEKSDSWFDCTKNNVGKLVSWKQSNTTYGLCIQENVVVFMNNCLNPQIFCEKKQDCVANC